MGIDYRPHFATAVDHCYASQLFPQLTLALKTQLLSHALVLPASGTMYDLARCTAAIDDAISALNIEKAGALSLTISSLLTEGSSKAGGSIYASDPPRRAPTPAQGGPAFQQHATQRNQLLGLPFAAQVDIIMQTLQEVEGARNAIVAVLKHRGAEGAWELLQQADKAFRDQDLSTLRDGGGLRTAGGCFLRLAKTMAGRDKTREVVASAPPPIELRSYQQRAVDAIMAGGNWVVGAPTGSGKTAIFIEVARRLLRGKPTAKVCVIVPSVALTDQHHASFLKSGGGGDFGPGKWLVESFSGDKQLLPRAWTDAYRTLSVVVCTAQLLANALDSGDFRLSQLDLLVLDECHHVAKYHPYSMIVRHYERDAAAAHTKIVGVSASPVNGGTQVELELSMQELCRRLRADLIPIVEDDAEVADVIARPEEVHKYIAVRPRDSDAAQHLLAFLQSSAIAVGDATLEAVASDAASAASKREVEKQHGLLVEAIKVIEQPGSRGRGAALTQLEQWNACATKMASRLALRSLGLCCQLITYGCRALALVSDAGYEAALQYLARKCCGLTIKHHQLQFAALWAIPGCSSNGGGGSSSGGGSYSGGGTSGLGGGYSSDGEEASGALQTLRLHVRNGPSAADVLAEVQGRGAAEAKRKDERCPDISATSVAELAAGFLASDHLNTIDGRKYVRDCFQSGVFQEQTTFPKFWALKAYLQKYRERPDGFHGIVFVATRQVVHFLADTIRRCSDLSFIDVCEVKGHNENSNERRSNNDATSQQRDRHAAGMSGAQQQQAVAAFRAPGFKLLIATSAVEEGIDVPNCEFVVRYNAAATGTQRLQSRGRARALRTSEFVCLLQDDTLDQHLHRKSEQEEAAMKDFMQRAATARPRA